MNALKLLNHRDQMQVFEELKGILQAYNIEQVAELAEVSSVTLYYWLSGQTRFPHLRTVVKVAYALGYELQLVKVRHVRRARLRLVR